MLLQLLLLAEGSVADVTVAASDSTYARRKVFPPVVVACEGVAELDTLPAGVISGTPLSDMVVATSLSSDVRMRPRIVAVEPDVVDRERNVEPGALPAGVMKVTPLSDDVRVALLALSPRVRPRTVLAEYMGSVDDGRIVPGRLMEPVDADAALWLGVRMTPPLEDEMARLPGEDIRDAA